MSEKNGIVRCDWCGKFSRNGRGEYTRPDGSAGYIHAPDWAKNGSDDICEECARWRCPQCGSDQIIQRTPAVAGPFGWGGRCKACEATWSIPVLQEIGDE